MVDAEAMDDDGGGRGGDVGEVLPLKASPMGRRLVEGLVAIGVLLAIAGVAYALGATTFAVFFLFPTAILVWLTYGLVRAGDPVVVIDRDTATIRCPSDLAGDLVIRRDFFGRLEPAVVDQLQSLGSDLVLPGVRITRSLPNLAVRLREPVSARVSMGGTAFASLATERLVDRLLLAFESTASAERFAEWIDREDDIEEGLIGRRHEQKPDLPWPLRLAVPALIVFMVASAAFSLTGDDDDDDDAGSPTSTLPAFLPESVLAEPVGGSLRSSFLLLIDVDTCAEADSLVARAIETPSDVLVEVTGTPSTDCGTTTVEVLLDDPLDARPISFARTDTQLVAVGEALQVTATGPPEPANPSLTTTTVG